MTFVMAEHEIRERAMQLRAATGGEEVYRSVSRLADARNATIRRQFFRRSRGAKDRVPESLLIPGDGKFLILVNNSYLGLAEDSAGEELRDWQRRWVRFRVAHEIGHTYWYQPRDLRRESAPDSAEEAICDRFAGVVLVGDLSESVSEGLAGVVARAVEADVSQQVAAHVLLDGVVSGWWQRPSDVPSDQMVIVGLSRRSNPRSGADRDWRIDWSVGGYMPRHARIGGNVVMAAAARGTASDVDLLRLRSRQGSSWFVSAVRVGGRIVAAVVAGEFCA